MIYCENTEQQHASPMCGGTNTHEDGTSLDGQHPVADDDDNDEQEVHKSTCTGVRGNADLIKG